MKIMYSDSYSEVTQEIFEKEHIGKLHSKFETSINLKFGNRLVNISSNQTVMPPFGIQVSSKSIKEIISLIEEDEVITFNKKENLLLFEKENLQLKLLEKKYTPKITPLKIDKKNAKKNIMKIIDYVLENNLENGFRVQNKEFINIIFGNEKSNSELCKRFQSLKEQIKSHNMDIQDYRYFLGRGEGLTPSGDDFLIGIMAVMAFNNDKLLEVLGDKLLVDIEKMTTDISCEYLYYARFNNFSLNIIKFCKKLFTYKYDEIKNQNELYSSYLRLIENGHTSGIDTLLGILLYSSTAFDENINEL